LPNDFAKNTEEWRSCRRIHARTGYCAAHFADQQFLGIVAFVEGGSYALTDPGCRCGVYRRTEETPKAAAFATAALDGLTGGEAARIHAAT